MVELRKGKMTDEQCRAALSKGNYFGTMLVKMGKADCLLGGATYSTADTVRPALQLIKCKPGIKSVSSCFILMRGDESIAMGDCAINIDPSEDEIVESTIETAHTAEVFGIDPRVALLSYSTKGSGKGETVDKMRNATLRVQEACPELKVDGELQFDAAVAPEVGQLKAPGSKVAGYANTFIFPNINAGNIGYKIAQRLGGFEAYGPILQGLNAPINDLSRGCNARRSIRCPSLPPPSPESGRYKNSRRPSWGGGFLLSSVLQRGACGPGEGRHGCYGVFAGGGFVCQHQCRGSVKHGVIYVGYLRTGGHRFFCIE